MHVGLVVLGIGAGGEVILADTDWIATALPTIYVGTTPMFVDILPNTWYLDPVLVKAIITSRTKAIVTVHLYGNLCEAGCLLDTGKCHGIPVVENAAEVIGSCRYEHVIGSRGISGTLSFHGAKIMITGEGGMLTINDRALYDRMMTLNNHDCVPGSKQSWSDFIGFRYCVSNV